MKVLNNIEDLTRVIISYEIYETSLGEFHKFQDDIISIER